jgi:hypothetical protein
MTETMLDKVADAIFNEEFFDGYPRWGTRDYRWGDKGFEVFRLDDSGCAGEFSYVWSGYESQDKADVALSEKLALSKARAALEAIREPDEAMQDAFYGATIVTREGAIRNFNKGVSAMIDAILSQSQERK